MKPLVNQTFDSERALYHVRDISLRNCRFEGPADGESALKESSDLLVEQCFFALRYPLWHTRHFVLRECEMPDTCRAPVWYSMDGTFENCKILGPKCLRECQDIRFENCRIVSSEFSWLCRDLTLRNTQLESEYPFFRTENVTAEHLQMNAKYSFQYVHRLHLKDSDLKTKDAFWHCSDGIIENCVITGEYLAWYSENMTFNHCKIIGTQPFCYCRNLKLIDCEMLQADLAFEYSDVYADIRGNIDSVKNPRSGSITADSFGNIILDTDTACPCSASVKIRK